MKRRIAWVLSLVLCLQLFAFGVSAESVQNEESGLENFSRWLEDTYQLVKTTDENGVTVVELVIPETLPDTKIATKLPVQKGSGVPGDLNGSGAVDVEDVIALLLYLSMPDQFTIQRFADYNLDSKETTEDAVYLLLHVSMPDQFPLEEGERPPYDYPELDEPAQHTELPYTQRYMYSTLSEEEKGWYRSIDTAVKNLDDTVKLGTDLPDNYYNVFYLYMMDNPEHFYLSGRIAYYPGSMATILLSYSDGTNHSGYGIGEITQALRDGIAQKKAQFNQKMNDIISRIPADLPAVEKEKLAYDYLLLNSCYNMDAVTNNLWDGMANDNWTAYGIMVEGTGVCESYAEAFQTLCLKMGINCTGITGTADGGGHKWNAVELDGEWYACDVTFDDPLGGDPNGTYHRYFNLTTKEMAADHSTAGSDFPGPDCTGTKYSFTNYFDK